MTDIVVQDNQVTSVVETTDGGATITVSGGIEVVSTDSPTTIVADSVSTEIIEVGQDTLVETQTVTTVVEAAAAAGVEKVWGIFRNDILPTEVVEVPSNSFLLGVSAFDLGGTVRNDGILVII
jgi:hypothetical protein